MYDPDYIMMNNRKKMRWESCHYDVFDILRFPLVILVIFIHCTIGIPDKPIIFDNILDIANICIIFRIYISNIISSLCVPAFFFMSGYLFYYKQPIFCWPIFWKKLKKRFYTLVIPYILWILLFFLFTVLLMIQESVSFQDWKESVTNYIAENGNLRIFYDSQIIETDSNYLPIGWQQDHSAPLLFTFWYMRDLIVVIIISPLLYSAIKQFRGYFVLVLGIAFIFNLWPCVHGISIVSIFFFTLGIYISSHIKVMELILINYYRIFIIAGSLLSVLCLYLFCINSLYYIYYIHLFSILGVFIAIYIGWFFINMGIRPISLLKYSAFFIYAAHMIYINRYCTLFILKGINCNNTLCGLLQYVVIPFVIAFVCLFFFYLFWKFFPRILSLLNGGRISV